MTKSSEQAVKDALKAHQGGLGVPLSEAQEHEIIYGRANEAENKSKVDGDKFFKCAVESLQRHPFLCE